MFFKYKKNMWKKVSSLFMANWWDIYFHCHIFLAQKEISFSSLSLFRSYCLLHFIDWSNVCRHVIRLIVAFKMNFPILLYKIDCKKWRLETQRFILFLFFHSYWNKQRVFEYLDFWWANWKKLQQIDNSGFELSFLLSHLWYNQRIDV